MNLSISVGVFPTLWKTAKVIPLFKPGEKSDYNNYRPISLLPIFSKVMEKHVKSTFEEFLKFNNLLSKQQFGFKKAHSTSDALLCILKSVKLSKQQREILKDELVKIQKHSHIFRLAGQLRTSFS